MPRRRLARTSKRGAEARSSSRRGLGRSVGPWSTDEGGCAHLRFMIARETHFEARSRSPLQSPCLWPLPSSRRSSSCSLPARSLSSSRSSPRGWCSATASGQGCPCRLPGASAGSPLNHDVRGAPPTRARGSRARAAREKSGRRSEPDGQDLDTTLRTDRSRYGPCRRRPGDRTEDAGRHPTED